MWPAIWVFIAIGVIEREPDLGTAAVLAVIVFAMMYLGGVTSRSLLLALAIALVGTGILVLKEPYRLDRITQHDSRWSIANVDDVGYQTVQSELGMATGGVVGVNVGNGRAKHVMPAATTDFVMATVAEETGLVGSLIVLASVGAVVWRLFSLAGRAPTKYGSLLLSGFGVWIAIQTTVNALMANGTLPAIGIPMPFISSGGSSLVALWMALGICQAAMAQQPVKEENREAGSYRWGHGRTRLSRA
jgi:cell division protein FtsW